MILVIGGSYQHKIKFAIEKFNIKEDEICDLSKSEFDFTKKMFISLNELVYENLDIDFIEYFKNNADNFKDKIIIVEDIFNGIVPLKKKERIYREKLGELTNYLSINSTEVYRVYFGIGEKLK